LAASIAHSLIACGLADGIIAPVRPSRQHLAATFSTMELRSFYERSYSSAGAEAETYSRWRQLSAVAKADHVAALSTKLAAGPARALDIGCGDGALIARLGSIRPQWSFSGVEIAERAVEIARARCPDADVRLYDGHSLPFETGAFRLGILSHVLEHVADPVALLREAARVSYSVIVEVPLEANVSTFRESKKQIARDVGHIQRFSRRGLRRVATAAGLQIARELSDPLGRDAHAFYAQSPAARARANTKWLVRAGLHALSSTAAQRLFTVHYACLCEPAALARSASS
jgi:SAM-dependent methyltransferase